MYCKNCGTQIDDNAKFCSSCGCNLTDETPIVVTEEASNAVAPKAKNKKDKLITLSLVLSCISVLLPIGLIFEIFLFAFIGIIVFIPAFILSTILLIISLVKFKKTREKTTALKKSIASSCLSTAFPIFVLLVSMIFQSPINYSKAVKAYEEKDYARANELFSELDDYKDSKEMAKECNYLKAIELAQKKDWKEAKSILNELATSGYKGSKALAVYCGVKAETDARISMAENKLYSNLKDPSSYQAINYSYSYFLTDRSISAVDMHLSISIKYSAKNSFGGRVTDTYNYETDVVLSQLTTYGLSAQKIEELMNKSITKIVSEYEK